MIYPIGNLKVLLLSSTSKWLTLAVKKGIPSPVWQYLLHISSCNLQVQVLYLRIVSPGSPAPALSQGRVSKNKFNLYYMRDLAAFTRNVEISVWSFLEAYCITVLVVYIVATNFYTWWASGHWCRRHGHRLCRLWVNINDLQVQTDKVDSLFFGTTPWQLLVSQYSSGIQLSSSRSAQGLYHSCATRVAWLGASVYVKLIDFFPTRTGGFEPTKQTMLIT